MTSWTTFACGGAAACIAEIATLPIDTTKVRLQLLKESATKPPSMLAVARGIVRDEGVRGLFKGLAPALQRQIVFASLRIGLYAEISDRLREPGAATLSLPLKILAGLLSGAIGITVANPTDLVKVRMQSEGRLAAGVKPRYSGVFNAYATIVRTEGVLGLWTGLGPAIMRNSIINATELASYEQSKDYFKASGMREGLPLHFAAATAAGFAATIVGSPVDVVKTRVMAARRAAESAGAPASMGAIECFSTMLRTEGPAAFYKGVTPAFFRLTGWSIVMFVTLEQLKLAFVKKVAGSVRAS
jgi:solute carrier family 25 uncoupling protein 8/9